MNKFWIVGKNTDYDEGAWEFQGLYDTEVKAVDRCENSDFWIAEVALNEFIPTDKSEWDKAYYPTMFNDQLKNK